MKRIGYYVEGRYYGNNFAQAQARAEWLARLYGRAVKVTHHKPGGVEITIGVARPEAA